MRWKSYLIEKKIVTVIPCVKSGLQILTSASADAQASSV